MEADRTAGTSCSMGRPTPESPAGCYLAYAFVGLVPVDRSMEFVELDHVGSQLKGAVGTPSHDVEIKVAAVTDAAVGPNPSR